MASVGENILRRRKELGLTQEELAERMGYKSKTSINKIEMGINDLPQRKLMDFAKALHTSPVVLLGLADEQEQKKSDNLAMVTAQLMDNSELFEVVSMVCKLPKEQLTGLKAFLAASADQDK